MHLLTGATVEQSQLAEAENELREATRLCNEMLGSAYEEYIDRIRAEISALPKGSKKWWRLNRVLLGRPTRTVSSIPPLRAGETEWAWDGRAKANLLGETFRAKNSLPEKVGDWEPKVSPS